MRAANSLAATLSANCCAAHREQKREGAGLRAGRAPARWACGARARPPLRPTVCGAAPFADSLWAARTQRATFDSCRLLLSAFCLLLSAFCFLLSVDVRQQRTNARSVLVIFAQQKQQRDTLSKRTFTRAR